MRPSVVVVMSTYNGEKYLRRQLDSVLSQDAVDLDVVVRDDGSQDDTVTILKEYEHSGAIRLIRGRNVGYVKSFFEALSATGNYDYYCFSDQDDIWMPDKVSSAVERLEKLPPGPKLYCSDLLFCDENCEHPHPSHLNKIGLGGQLMLYETICSGNTMVFNHETKDLALVGGADDVFGHDWWFGLVTCALGKVVWDETPHILYRRTGDNTSPTGKNAIELAVYRIRKLVGGGKLPKIRAQIRRFYELYGRMIDDEDLLRKVRNASEGNRFQKAFAGGRYRQKLVDEILLRLVLLLGLL
ncbi:MAG: glycosyltransferase [Coriobacteriales bacterium]